MHWEKCGAIQITRGDQVEIIRRATLLSCQPSIITAAAVKLMKLMVLATTVGVAVVGVLCQLGSCCFHEVVVTNRGRQLTELA